MEEIEKALDGAVFPVRPVKYNECHINSGCVGDKFSKVRSRIIACDVILGLIQGFVDLVATFNGDLPLSRNTTGK